jgi:hypothetical protein
VSWGKRDREGEREGERERRRERGGEREEERERRRERGGERESVIMGRRGLFEPTASSCESIDESAASIKNLSHPSSCLIWRVFCGGNRT